MNYSFHPSAIAEFISAAEYYREIQNDLALDFIKEVYLAIERIIQFPEAWPNISPGIRRSLCKRFPYGVLYSIAGNEIFIIAVMHMMKKPGYWKTRV